MVSSFVIMSDDGVTDAVCVKHFRSMARGEIPVQDFYVLARKKKTDPVLTGRGPPPASPTDPRDREEDIMGDIPNSLRHKARALLRHMDDTLMWNGKGEIVYEGDTVRGSNIEDLIEDAVRGYTNDTPEGTDVFYEALGEMGIPPRLIYNKERLLDMERYRRRGPPGKRTRYL